MPSTLKEMLDMQDRTCLITGACGYVGEALTFAFSEMGCNLILLDHPSIGFLHHSKYQYWLYFHSLHNIPYL